MITLTAANVILISTMIMTMKAHNPVKLSISMMALALMLFQFMSFLSGQSWFSTIFLMIFIGGIMLMFMILSSLSPNMPSGKINYFILYSISSLIMFLNSTLQSKSEFVLSKMNFFFSGSMNLLILTLFMAIYFFLFISVMSKSSGPLQSNLCF